MPGPFAPSRRVVGSAVIVILAIALAVMATGRIAGGLRAQEKARVIPPPSADESPSASKSEVAVLAGGCFWGVQAVFQHVKGVSRAVSGYAGGRKGTASYETVSRGNTGHAESVQVLFDPRQVSYGQLLQVFFSVAHDPTQLNRQGPDVGTQYRSTIFPTSAEQQRIAQAYITQLKDARAFDAAIVTTIEPDRPFYDAEDYHQDFLVRNPRHPYIVVNDLPKIDELKRVFPGLFRPVPVLVGPGR